MRVGGSITDVVGRTPLCSFRSASLVKHMRNPAGQEPDGVSLIQLLLRKVVQRAVGIIGYSRFGIAGTETPELPWVWVRVRVESEGVLAHRIRRRRLVRC